MPSDVRGKFVLEPQSGDTGSASSYIKDMLQPVSELHQQTHLQSASKSNLVIPQTRLKFSERVFSVAATHCSICWHCLWRVGANWLGVKHVHSRCQDIFVVTLIVLFIARWWWVVLAGKTESDDSMTMPRSDGSVRRRSGNLSRRKSDSRTKERNDSAVNRARGQSNLAEAASNALHALHTLQSSCSRSGDTSGSP